MPQPNLSQVHVDAPLTMISVAYIQDADHFIASKVFPILPVDKKSDLYYTYTKDDWFRDEAKPRGLSEESAGSGYNLDHSGSYNCVDYAFHKDIDDKTRANSDTPLNPDRDATEFVTQRMLLRQEIQWASDNFTTGKWATDKTGGTDFTQWSDYAGSDPVDDIEAGKEQILSTTGFEANTLVLAYPVYRKLKQHPIFKDMVKYTGGPDEQVQIQKILAQVFDLKNVYVAKAIKNTAAEGQAGSYSFTHGKGALLCHVADNPGLLVPSAGYQFMWKGVSSGLGEKVAIKRIRMEWLNTDRIEGEVSFDNKIIASDLGYFFSGAVA